MNLSKRVKYLGFISIIIIVFAMVWLLSGEKRTPRSSHGEAMAQELLSLVHEGQAQCVIVCGTEATPYFTTDPNEHGLWFTWIA